MESWAPTLDSSPDRCGGFVVPLSGYGRRALTWEPAIKSSLGKLVLPAAFADAVVARGLRDLPVTGEHTLATDATALDHRDPFDARLVAQAKVERLGCLTDDRKLLGAVPQAVDASLGGEALSRRTASRLLAVYALMLAVVLLNPSAAIPSGVVGLLTDAAHALGMPSGLVSGGRVEFLTNAVMLMPLSALGLIVWPHTNWRDWTAYAFVVASSVELVQALLLPARSAAFVDIVANTLGGALGAAAVTVARWHASRSDD